MCKSWIYLLISYEISTSDGDMTLKLVYWRQSKKNHNVLDKKSILFYYVEFLKMFIGDGNEKRSRIYHTGL
jgi:hypothetical protein